MMKKQTKWDNEFHENQGVVENKPNPLDKFPKKYQNTPFGAVSGPTRNSKYNTFGISDKSKFY